MEAGTIQSLMRMQRRFMDVIGMRDNDDMAEDRLILNPEFMGAVTGLIAESAEVLGAVTDRSRPWAPGSGEDEQRKHVVEETIDVLFFLLETLNILGLNDVDVFSQYVRKFTINMARILAKQPVEFRRKLFQEAYRSEQRFMTKEMEGTGLEEAALCIISVVEGMWDKPSLNSYLEDLVNDPVAFVRGMFDGKKRFILPVG